MWAPQPDVFTITTSTLASSKTSMRRLASVTAWACSPPCAWSAPQHAWARGATTSAPFLARTRAVARFWEPKATCWMHPVSRPTRARLGPRAGVSSGGGAEQTWTGKEHVEIEPAEESPRDTARALALDLCATGLDELAVRHPRWADRLAGAAAEAEIEMRLGRLRQGDAPLGQRLDQHDAAARRVHLGAEDREGRAIGEAEPAMHAAIDAFHVEPVELERFHAARSLDRMSHQMPPATRPGLSTPRGSSCALMRSMTRRAGPASSHTGTRSLTASGAHWTTACPPAPRTRVRHSPSTAATRSRSACSPPPRAASTMPTPAWAAVAARRPAGSSNRSISRHCQST